MTIAHLTKTRSRRRSIVQGHEQERCESVPGRSGGDVLSPTVLFVALHDGALSGRGRMNVNPNVSAELGVMRATLPSAAVPLRAEATH